MKKKCKSYRKMKKELLQKLNNSNKKEITNTANSKDSLNQKEKITKPKFLNQKKNKENVKEKEHNNYLNLKKRELNGILKKIIQFNKKTKLMTL